MDKFTTINNSTVHHGNHNKRAYITSFCDDSGESTIKAVEGMAEENNYEKIVAKINSNSRVLFENCGYNIEASFPTSEDRYFFMSKFLDDERAECASSKSIEKVINKAKEYTLSEIECNNHNISKLSKEHIPDIIKIYDNVFATYPFPIHDKTFISNSMDSDTHYYGVFNDSNLVAVSSAEICRKSRTSEMTDFATLPEYRGMGFASSLLMAMEGDLKGSEISTFFTIARAVSFGMNITFSKAGYSFGGTLIKNTNISGNIESMNVWFKQNA